MLEMANFPCTELVCDTGSGAQVLYLGAITDLCGGLLFPLKLLPAICV